MADDDTVIETDCVRVRVSKVVLSGCSEYFKALFCEKNKFAEEGKHKIVINVGKGIESVSFRSGCLCSSI